MVFNLKKIAKKLLKKVLRKKHEHKFKHYPNVGVMQCIECEEIEFIRSVTTKIRIEK